MRWAAAVTTSLVFNVCMGLVCSELTRKVTTEFRCNSLTYDGGNVAYSRAVGLNDTLHYVISTVGVPTVLVFHTALDSDPRIDCTRLLSGNVSAVEKSITFTEIPIYTYALMFSKLYEYDDVNDTASLTKASRNESAWRVYDLSLVHWDDASSTSDVPLNTIEFRLSTNGTLNFHDNGSLNFKLHVSNTTDRGKFLPHLEFTANSTHVDFSLNGAIPTFDKSRFALEMTLVTSDKSTQSQTLTNHRSIDDEHSPGVFEVVDWVSSSVSTATGAYLQWKSVCYREEVRSVTSSTGVTTYDLQTFNASRSISVAYAYFGDRLVTPGELSMRMTNVSFGLAGDHFYPSTNYSVWSFTVGYGFPPKDHISLLIIMVISVGLGLPVLLLLAGSVYVFVKRRLASSSVNGASFTSSYQQIN